MTTAPLSVPTAPPPPPPSMMNHKIAPKPVTNPALLKLGGSQNVDREELMRSIKNGVRLRKATTIDKSAPVIHADIESQEPLQAPQHQKFGSWGSSLIVEKEKPIKESEATSSKEEVSVNENTSATVYQPPVHTDYTPQFNTLPRAQSQQTSRLLTSDTFASSNGTMPRAKKADECYTSPIPTREMIEAEIPTGSAANKIKLLNSLHSRTQSQSPVRALTRPTVSRTQLKNGVLAKFTQINQNSNGKPDENTAPLFKAPVSGNPVSKSSSMNSIKKMAQRFDNNAISAQQNVQPKRLWKSSSTAASNSGSFIKQLSKAEKLADTDELPKSKTAFPAVKPLKPANKDVDGTDHQQVFSGSIRSHVKKLEDAQQSVKKNNAYFTPRSYAHPEVENGQSVKQFENIVAPSSSSLKDEKKHLKIVSSDDWRREPKKFHPAVPTTSAFENQNRKLSKENYRSMPQISPGARSVTQESVSKKLEMPKQQRSVSSENIPQYSYEPIHFKPAPARTTSKPSLFKYIVPIEIDTTENPPPVPLSLPPPLSPVVQSSVQRSIINQNGNSREHLSEPENIGPKPYGSNSMGSLYSAPSSRSINSMDNFPASQGSSVIPPPQSDSSPNSSTSLSPMSSVSRSYADPPSLLARPFNGNKFCEAKPDARGRPLLHSVEAFYVTKPDIRNESMNDMEQNGNERWPFHPASRSTPQLVSYYFSHKGFRKIQQFSTELCLGHQSECFTVLDCRTVNQKFQETPVFIRSQSVLHGTTNRCMKSRWNQ